MNLRIEALEITDDVLDKIEFKHGVRFEEIEGACYSQDRHVRRSREGVYCCMGGAKLAATCGSRWCHWVKASGGF